MKRTRNRKCRHCEELFRPDPRNVRHQHYCSKSECRRASKQASQRRWLGKAANRGYFRGVANFERVRAWREAHPGYWRRTAQKASTALQEDSLAQVVDSTDQSSTLTATALQDLLSAQPLVFIGLIAHLTGSTLQDDIAVTGQRFRQLGYDILTGAAAGAEGACDAKTPAGPYASAPDPPSVQLGRSTPGA